MKTEQMTMRMQLLMPRASVSSGAWIARSGPGRRTRRRLVGLLGGVLGSLSVGCKELTQAPGLPAGTPDPAIYNSPSGALGMRNAAIWSVEQAVPAYVVASGLLTDELDDPLTGASTGVLDQYGGTVVDPLDERILPEGTSATNQVAIGVYDPLQTTRTYILQALGALATYDTAAKDTAAGRRMRSELYALLGYDEILLADLFCSGVPLSTITFHGDYVYAPGSTTPQVYQDAIAKLDTALRLSGGQDSVTHLALVLRGRAELALGNYPAAADDVTSVPTDFQYQLFVQWAYGVSSGSLLHEEFGIGGSSILLGTLATQEGGTGLNYLTASDPRTAAVPVSTNSLTQLSMYFPAKYDTAVGASHFKYAPFVVASGVEARLIQAEAALNGVTTGTDWLGQLNALRTDQPLLAAWTHNPGVAALSDTSDPGTLTARIQLLFRERAFWLFLDGHRQGDLRRLLRQYGQVQGNAAFRSDEQVYPTGAYLAPGVQTYGTDVTVPPDAAESANPKYHGCIDRNP